MTKAADKVYELHITATMDKGWDVYAMQQPKDAISVPTRFGISPNPLIVLDGKMKESGKKETYTDAAAGITQYQYAGKVEYVKVFKIKAAVKANISGTVTFQACIVEMCLPANQASINN